MNLHLFAAYCLAITILNAILLGTTAVGLTAFFAVPERRRLQGRIPARC